MLLKAFCAALEDENENGGAPFPSPGADGWCPHSSVYPQGKAVHHFYVWQTLQTLALCTSAIPPLGRMVVLPRVLLFAGPLLGERLPIVGTPILLLRWEGQGFHCSSVTCWAPA